MVWNNFKRKDILTENQLEHYEHCRDRGTQILQSAKRSDEFTKLEPRIREEFSLYHRWSAQAEDVVRFRENEILAVEHIPGLSRVFMFHGDGRVREAAMNHLAGPLIAPANVYALFWRLNDWAPEVRNAAAHAVKRCLLTTPAVVIAPALKALLPHIPYWGRWSCKDLELVDELLMRQDVAEVLLKEVIHTRQANLGLLFRNLCRNPWIDHHLEQTFNSAALPHIRAMALDALLAHKPRWPAQKMRKVWIDRFMGRYRLEPVFFEREITVDVDVPYCLQIGAIDKASIVRKRTADGLIAFRNDDVLSNQLDEIADLLKGDKNLGVQGRIDFLIRKRKEEYPSF